MVLTHKEFLEIDKDPARRHEIDELLSEAYKRGFEDTISGEYDEFFYERLYAVMSTFMGKCSNYFRSLQEKAYKQGRIQTFYSDETILKNIKLKPNEKTN